MQVADTTIKQYESRIAELEKATILPKIQLQQLPPSLPSFNITADASTTAEAISCNCEMQLTQLMGENEDLKAILGELRSELEALKDHQMERMECSISSPARMSLGTVLKGLEIDQDSQGGNMSSNISYDLEAIFEKNRRVRAHFLSSIVAYTICRRSLFALQSSLPLCTRVLITKILTHAIYHPSHLS